ncbi:VRR-NUC domain-containing protein [Bradyrhizobium sp. AUGA SZCCT0177]|uniref:VRR-NUC domain-containing protein n=1 Tax=Bradyrhizobium sp. AUGA SZCCT0177 TaxID=2807665 RepID=UPI001BAD22B4|nr:VRR-NUC domain-containing protein [Bradyrhizobium sp. AUGA SZCCT0177]MBR1286061.1 VRR-NUC domain-containing protein [Bradyrhizobium sp. AUGA SZCCT0177]
MTAARQLHLFKSRRQRGQAPPPPSEFASQAFLVSVVRRWLDPHWRFCHVANGEARSPSAARRCRRLGVVAGWPDLQFAGPDKQMAFLEMKRRGGRLSDAQAAMRDHLEGCGFAYLCTDDVNQAIAWLKQHGILRGGFTVQ